MAKGNEPKKAPTSKKALSLPAFVDTPARRAAMALGADCARCLLRDRPVVLGGVGGLDYQASGLDGGPVVPAGWAIVGDLPGLEEEKGEPPRPFIGPAGQELDRALSAAGFARRSSTTVLGRPLVTNVLACRPSDGEWRRLEQRITRNNRALADGQKIGGQAPIPGPGPGGTWLTPRACCKARLDAELDAVGARHILAVGSMAMERFAGTSAVQEHRGTLSELTSTRQALLSVPDEQERATTPARFLGTFNPAFVLRYPRWTQTFHGDVAKATRWFTDRLNWAPVKATYHPRPKELLSFLLHLTRTQGWVIYDVETDSKEPLTANLRCIGVGTTDEVMVVGCWSIAATRWWRQERARRGLGDWEPFGGDAETPEEAERWAELAEGRAWLETKQGRMALPAEPHMGAAFGYSKAEFREIVGIIYDWATGGGPFKDLPNRAIVAHNGGSYDGPVMRRFFGLFGLLPLDPRPLFDTIMAHRLMASELPHSLDYTGSTLTDVHRWKAGHVATETESDQVLHEYNGPGDVAVNARILAPILEAVEARGQSHLLTPDHAQQYLCQGMKINGMALDQRRVAKLEKELDAEIAKAWAVCMKVAQQEGVQGPGAWVTKKDENGKATWTKTAEGRRQTVKEFKRDPHNPRSFPQVAGFLYDHWGLPVPHYTDEGEASTDDKGLLTLLRDKRLRDNQRDYILALRDGREHSKAKSTFLLPLKPRSFTWEAADGEIRHGACLEDGRIHPGYNAHVPVTGRVSSGDPINAQNLPKKFRKAFRPQTWLRMSLDERRRFVAQWNLWRRVARERFGVDAPEILFHDGWAWVRKGTSHDYENAVERLFPRVYVGADEGQLELRIAAALAGCERYLEVFRAGGDPHAVTAEHLYGDAFRSELAHLKATGKKTEAFNRMRDFAKTFVYLVIYGGSAETAWHNLQATQDPKTGKFTYAHVEQAEVERLRDRWLRGAPEFERWWDTTVADFRRDGALYDPVDGRRRDFLDGEDFNELVNFRVQTAGAALVRHSTLRLVDGLDEEQLQAFALADPKREERLAAFGGIEAFRRDPMGGPLSFERCWSEWGPGTGLVTQTHDANLFEVPRREGKRVASLVTEAMSWAIGELGLDVQFIGDARQATDWKSAA